ncbi:MAG: hypothetical protein CM1200mP10_08380 [Candidatus Neomarinimicrobiota bacterium]|nr:MAG: hypothetical protein CM1200mP10_08380 [Candidatus Neomarinimicrobiota bacterium]
MIVPFTMVCYPSRRHLDFNFMEPGGRLSAPDIPQEQL